MAGIDSKMAGIATYLPHFFYTAELVSMDDFLWYTDDDDDDNFKSFIYKTYTMGFGGKKKLSPDRRSSFLAKRKNIRREWKLRESPVAAD